MSPDGAAGNESATIEAEASGASLPQPDQTTPTTTAAADQEVVASDEVTTAEGASEDESAQDAEAAAADAADLAQYPEALRDDELFKSLSPAKRKAMYEHAEKHVEDRITRERERNDKLEADRKAQEARQRELTGKIGQFVGAEAQTYELPDGATVTVPPYDEMVTLSRTQRGRDTLLEKYGLDTANTEFWVSVLDRNREMGAVLNDANWATLDGNLRDGLRSNGFDPDVILKDARSGHDIISQLTSHLKAEHAAEIKKLTSEHEAQLGARDANAEGMRGRVLAATAREMPTGGRSGAGGEPPLTSQAYRAMTYEQRQQLRSTPEGRARIDEMMARGH